MTESYDHTPEQCPYENGCSGCCSIGDHPELWCEDCGIFTVHADRHDGHEVMTSEDYLGDYTS